MKQVRDHETNDVDNIAAVSLPEEIIEEILLKIASPKSLMRCKCVCKSWLSLIRNYKFAAMHLRRRHQCHHHPSSSSLSILVFHDTLTSACCFSVHSDDHKGRLVQCYDGFPVANHRQGRVISSCNGIVCLQSIPDIGPIKSLGKNQLVHLWNPTTRELKTLLPHHNLCSPHSYDYYNLHELFYEPLMGDYKVLRIRQYHMKRQVNKYGYSVDLYSLASNSWRLIDDDANMFEAGSVTHIGFMYMVYRGSSGVVNGRYLHWIAQIKHHENNHVPWLAEWYIVCFNLQRELFEQIKPPPNLKTTCEGIKLGNLFECLTVLYDSDYMETDIWVMKEHGVTASWTKLFTISHAIPSTILGLENSGKLVIKYNRTQNLAWYDLKSTNPWHATELEGVPYDHCTCELVSHVQTISPIMGAGQ